MNSTFAQTDIRSAEVHAEVVEPSVEAADQLVGQAIAWLGEVYGNRVFYVERDIVYAVQCHLNELITELEGPWTVYNDYAMLAGPRRGFSADLAVLGPSGEVAVAIEFKYEPCHRRVDVQKKKLPVTVWSEIVKDTVRVRDFVDQGKAAIGYAICIDEGGYLVRRDLAVYADRQEWDGRPRHDHEVDALIFRYSPTS